MSNDSEAIAVRLGVRSDQPDTPVTLSEGDLNAHMAIYGGSRRGKSKLMEHILRQLVHQRAGFCLIDPHGDLTEDILAYVAHCRDEISQFTLHNLHYLQPAEELEDGTYSETFSFDPLDRSRRPSISLSWLEARAERIAKAVIRMRDEWDFQDKPLLERWMKNVIIACGVPLDSTGRHFPLSEAQFLLDYHDPRWSAFIEHLAPLLPPAVQHDFIDLSNAKDRDREQRISSTINRFRSFLTDVVRATLSCRVPTIDFRDIVKRRGIVLVNLRETEGFVTGQANAIGALVITQILDTIRTTPRDQRSRFYLFIDEASRFIGQDLEDALAQSAKWKLSVCLAVQDLSGLRKAQFDMVSKTISQCGVQITFRQKNPDDLDTLGPLFTYGQLDRTPLVSEVDRIDGTDIMELTDESSSTSSQRGSSFSSGESGLPGSHRDDTRQSAGWRDGTSETESRSRTLKRVPITKYRTEEQQTGKLETSVSDQKEFTKEDIRRLKRATAMASVDDSDQLDEPFVLEVDNVEDPYEDRTPGLKTAAIEGMKKRIFSAHPWYFRPDFSPRDYQLRLEHLIPSGADLKQGESSPEALPSPIQAVDDDDSPFDPSF